MAWSGCDVTNYACYPKFKRVVQSPLEETLLLSTLWNLFKWDTLLITEHGTEVGDKCFWSMRNLCSAFIELDMPTFKIEQDSVCLKSTKTRVCWPQYCQRAEIDQNSKRREVDIGVFIGYSSESFEASLSFPWLLNRLFILWLDSADKEKSCLEPKLRAFRWDSTPN